MKTKFKKLVLITHEKEHSHLIASLQDLGVLHLERNDVRENDEIEDAIHEKNKLSGVLKLLNKVIEDEKPKGKTSEPVEEVVQKILELEEKIDHLEQEIETDSKEYEKIQFWGTFTYDRFLPMLERGYQVFLCSSNRKMFQKLELDDLYYKVVNKTSQEVYFIVFTQEEDLELPVEYFPIPKKSTRELKQDIKNGKAEISKLYHQLSQFTPYIPQINKDYLRIKDRVELLEAKYSSEFLSGGNMISISGWFPEEKEEKVREFMDQQTAGYLIRGAINGESPPVLLKNREYPKLFEPITRIFELPNYHEADLTPFIAVFYPILFAYCLGDAGYGFVLSTLMGAGYFTFLKDSRKVALLGFILGIFTMVMGLVKSGSLFGIMLLDDHQWSFIRYLSQFVVIPDDSEFIFNAFNVALMIGVVQILTGIFISIYNKIRYERSLVAVSAVGKLLIVLSLIWIFLADMQKMEDLNKLGDLRVYTLILGMILVAFFHQMDIPVGKRAASSVMPLFFIFTGILGDILSYVRLFALGLASSVLGLVVNQIGDQIMSGGGISLVIGILFLIFGHSLNFGIAALGSFVHPLRLTFVEFYGNANFTGKGITYKPFSKSIKSTQNT